MLKKNLRIVNKSSVNLHVASRIHLRTVTLHLTRIVNLTVVESGGKLQIF